MELIGTKNASAVKSFSRRAFAVGVLQIGFLGVLGARLAWLQVVQGPKYKMLSDKNSIDIKMLAPSRGIIVDCFGKPLAVNHKNFSVQVTPEQTENLEAILRRLQKIIELESEDVKRVLKMASKSAKFVPIQIKNNLSWEEVAKVEVRLPALPGLSIHVGEVRHYPLKESSAHIVGYVGLPIKKQIENNPVLAMPGLKVGMTAIEKTYNDNLMGKPGSAQVEVNVVGREIRVLKKRESISGDRVVLSVDSGLQEFVQERLKQERSASAVIMDAKTGAVYALSSHPAFDPNLFTKGLSVEKWEGMLSDPGHPLTNKAVAGQYPPASTFKMVTALAGLRSGHVGRASTAYCPGYYDYAGDRFHCWKAAGHETVDVVSALSKSCDTFFYKYATEIGIDNIAKTARILGLGDKLGFDLGEERPGLVPDKGWKMGHHGASWKAGETIVASIGQGYLQATPLQMAVMTARLVNGGYAVKPWLVSNVERNALNQEKRWPKMDMEARHLALIKKGMDKTVNDRTGTAYKSRIDLSGYSMGGKTGTAQVRRISRAQREQGIRMEDLPWKHRHHGLFVGYAPIVDPRYICAVVVEHGIGGSSSAAPLARDILLQAQKRKPFKGI